MQGRLYLQFHAEKPGMITARLQERSILNGRTKGQGSPHGIQINGGAKEWGNLRAKPVIDCHVAFGSSQ